MNKLFALLALVEFICALDSGSLGKVNRLNELSSKSEVIQLTQKTFYEFALKQPRNYNFVILFIAVRRETQAYGKILDSFIKVAESYKASQLKNNHKVFFAVYEYNKESEGLFRHLGFTQFSCLLLTRPEFKLEDEKFIYPIEDLMKISNPAEAEALAIVKFLNYRLGEKVELQESMAEALLFVGFLFIACISFAAFVYNLPEFFMDPLIWFVFSIVIYFLSTSGVVYDILKLPALYGSDENGNKIMINQKQRSQYMIEGFIMSGVSVIAGLCLVGLNTIRTVDGQIKLRIYASLLLLSMFYCLMNVKNVYTLKNPWYNPGFSPPQWYVKGPLSKDQGLIIGLGEDEKNI